MTTHRSALLIAIIMKLLASLGPTANAEAQAQIVGSTDPRLDTSPAKDGTVQTDPFVIVRTYPTGSGPTFTQVGVTAEGLVTELISPEGVPDHISANAYAVCYEVAGRTVTAFETGRGSAHLGLVTITERKGLGVLPIVFTRTTDDGILELKRTITLDQDGLTIEMGIKNRSGSKIEMLRWKEVSDFAIVGEPINNIGRTLNSVFVWVDLGDRQDSAVVAFFPPLGTVESVAAYRESHLDPFQCSTGSLPTPAPLAAPLTVEAQQGKVYKQLARVLRSSGVNLKHHRECHPAPVEVTIRGQRVARRRGSL